jgi:Dual specificity phosphatase, catalytic domain
MGGYPAALAADGQLVFDPDLGKFDVVINATPTERPPGVGGRYIAVPLFDEEDEIEDPAKGEMVRQAAGQVADALAKGKRVLVHCVLGFNRSGVICARALLYSGVPVVRAITLVRENRSAFALGNQGFVDWLLEEAGLPPPSGCPLCPADRVTCWRYEDEWCWVADCIECSTPMVVFRSHQFPNEAQEAHALARLSEVAATRYPEGHRIDLERRKVPDHFHAHARPAPNLTDALKGYAFTSGEYNNAIKVAAWNLMTREELPSGFDQMVPFRQHRTPNGIARFMSIRDTAGTLLEAVRVAPPAPGLYRGEVVWAPDAQTLMERFPLGRELTLSLVSFSSVEDTARGYALMWRDNELWGLDEAPNDERAVCMLIVLRPGAPALPVSEQLSKLGPEVPREVDGSEYLTAGRFRVIARELLDTPVPPLDPSGRRPWDLLSRMKGGPSETWLRLTVEHSGSGGTFTLCGSQALEKPVDDSA